MNECTLLFANVNESMSSSTWWKQLKKEGIIILVRWGFKKDFKKKISLTKKDVLHLHISSIIQR